MKFDIPIPVKKTASVLLNAGLQAFIVGGAVRDTLLRRPVNDWDIATDALPEKVMSLFRRVIPTGIKHGTVTVIAGDFSIEVTTFRTEGPYSDFRRPDAVTWSGSIEDDLCRRDFSVNAIAFDMNDNRLVDPFEGRRDLDNRLLRAIGSPVERFKEDPLRIMRACRFTSQLDFSIEKLSFEAMKETSPLIVNISAERIRDEFVKILLSPAPSVGIRMMRESLILGMVLPELAECIGVDQPELHSFDVYSHSLHACDGAGAGNPIVRLAALFHDIGKPACLVLTEQGERRFYGHEKKGAEMTRSILTRLRFPTRDIDAVCLLVREHMFHYDPAWSDAAVRRFIRRVGKDRIGDIIALRRADQFGMRGERIDSPLLDELKERIDTEISLSRAFTLRDLAINGDMLKRELGLMQSPVLGTILDFLLESVLEDPAMNTAEKLLEIARNFYLTRISGTP